MKILVAVLIVAMIMLSCSGKKMKLSEEDYKWMPYKGNETLLFRSSTGDIDSVYLIMKETMKGYFEPQTSSDSYEEVVVFERHLDTYASNGQNRYLENKFFGLKKNAKGKTELEISVIAKDAVFYRLSAILLDSLKEVKPASVKTYFRQYNDVYLIGGEDYSGDFMARSNFITRLYWSRSAGLIRYEKMNGVFWELSQN